METLIGYIVIMGGLLTLATLHKPQMREPGTPSQRWRANRRFYQPVKNVSNRTKGGSSHG